MNNMQKLQVGDTITTAEELDALPREVVARTSTGWTLITPVNSRVPFLEPDYPMTILYLPGHPPRPEREVKAEALREAADAVAGIVSYGAELRPDGREDPTMGAYVQGLHDAYMTIANLLPQNDAPPGDAPTVEGPFA